jgi:hypothetical protein
MADRDMDYELEYLGQRLHLRLPGSGLLEEFLKRYFVPYFRFEPASPAGSDGGIFAALEVRIGPPPDGTPSFEGALAVDIDRSKGMLACTGGMVERDGTRWVLLRPFDVVARIRLRERQVTLWGRTEAALRIPSLRLIEDLTTEAVERAGGAFVHASAVVADGQAVLALGNKHSGKTSFLCRTLHGFAADKLANDNCCLTVSEGRVLATGWPCFLKIELGTVASLEELAGDFPAAHRHLLRNGAALWAHYEKIALFPGQGAERFGTAIVPQAPLGALVLPRFRRDAAPCLRPAELAEVAGDLSAYLQGSRNPNHPAWMGIEDAGAGRAEANLGRVLRAAGPELPVYRLEWAPSLDDLLSDIPLLRPARKTLRQCLEAAGTADDWPPLPDPDRPDAVPVRALPAGSGSR